MKKIETGFSSVPILETAIRNEKKKISLGLSRLCICVNTLYTRAYTKLPFHLAKVMRKWNRLEIVRKTCESNT